MKKNKGLALLVSLSMIISSGATTVFADPTHRWMTQDLSILFERDNEKKPAILFGAAPKSTNLNRPLWKATEDGAFNQPNQLILFHNGKLDKLKVKYANTIDSDITYKDSLVHQKLTELYDSLFSEQEKKTIIPRDSFPLWSLSRSEAENIKQRIDFDTQPRPYFMWLREDAKNKFVPVLANDLRINPSYTITGEGYLLPAFSIDRGKILFLSLTGGDIEKYGISQFPESCLDHTTVDLNFTRKLTLKDEERKDFTIKSYSFGPSAQNDSVKLTVNYSNAKSGKENKNEYLSLIFKKDASSAEISAYGNLSPSHSDPLDLPVEGEASIDIPKKFFSNLMDNSSFYIFQEQRNINISAEMDRTDYASDFIPILTKFGLKQELTGLKPDGVPQKFDILKELNFKLLLDDDSFKLPKTIEILVNDQPLSDTEFTYNAETGDILIPSDSVLGNITVRAAAVPKIASFTAVPNQIDFPDITAGYTAAPPSEIKVSNTGERSLSLRISLEGANADSFTVSEDEIRIQPQQEISFSISPKAKLASGNYTAEIKLEETAIPNLTSSIPIRLHVAEAPPAPPAPRPTPKTYRISLSSSNVDFGDQNGDYQAETLKKSIRIRNEGTGNIYLQEVQSDKSPSNFEIDFSPSSLYPSGSAEISLHPKEGLPAGIYEENFTLKTNRSSADKQFTVRFRVKEKEYVEWEERVDVPLDKVWTIRLNRELDAKSLSSENVSITDDKGLSVSAKLSLGEDLKTILIYPEKDFDPNSTYQLSIRALLSADGKVLKDNVRMKFTTVNPL